MHHASDAQIVSAARYCIAAARSRYHALPPAFVYKD